MSFKFLATSVAVGLAGSVAVAQSDTGPWPAHPLWPEVPETQKVECSTDSLPTSRLGIQPRGAWQTNLWPGGIVPYTIDAAVTTTNRNRLRIAMDEIQTFANVTFVPRTAEPNFLYVQNSTGNNSFVGRIGGSQTVNLFNWDFRYIIIHELMHALGCWHEQNRPDRDTYVVINLANVCQTCCGGGSCNGNFNLQAAAAAVGTYDFQSIMHYSPTAFSTNGQPTITAQPAYAAFQSQMGNLSFMSNGDKAGVSSRYGAPVDDGFEPNDTRPTAQALPRNTTHNLKLLNDDFFAITATGASVTVTGTAPGIWAGSNASIQLLNAAGTVLASVAFVQGTSSATISITQPVTPGPYTVRVLRSQPWGGAYQLTVTSPCGADFDGVGGLTVSDIFAFLQAFFSGSMSADFDRSGGLMVADIFAFLKAWFAGC